jgi:cytochrome b
VAGQAGERRATIWDLPIRLFHWALVILIAAAWATQEQLDDSERHAVVGYLILTLLMFRLLWGAVGSETARFSSFVRGPAKVWAYLRGSGGASVTLGHNPLGGYSVAALLTLIGVQAGTGLFLYDDEMFWGPLNGWVSEDTSEWLADVHELNFKLLLGLITLHVATIAFYAVARRRNLLFPMLTGRAALPEGAAAPRIASSALALLLLGIAAGAVWALVTYA